LIKGARQKGRDNVGCHPAPVKKAELPSHFFCAQPFGQVGHNRGPEKTGAKQEYPVGSVEKKRYRNITKGEGRHKGYQGGAVKNFGRFMRGTEAMIQIAAQEEEKLPEREKDAYLPRAEVKPVGQTKNQRKVHRIKTEAKEKRAGEDKVVSFHQ